MKPIPVPVQRYDLFLLAPNYSVDQRVIEYTVIVDVSIKWEKEGDAEIRSGCDGVAEWCVCVD